MEAAAHTMEDMIRCMTPVAAPPEQAPRAGLEAGPCERRSLCLRAPTGLPRVTTLCDGSEAPSVRLQGVCWR